MGAYIQLGALAIQTVFMAIALSAVATGTKRIVSAVLSARREDEMKKRALVEGARARAAARAERRKKQNNA